MRNLVQAFIKNGKAQALLDAQKRAKTHSIQSIFSAQDTNSINYQQNLIELMQVDFKRIDLASLQLEKARALLVSAMASLEGFEGLSRRELLLAANFTHGYIYMLGEFVRQKQENTAKPDNGLKDLKGWRGNA